MNLIAFEQRIKEVVREMEGHHRIETAEVFVLAGDYLDYEDWPARTGDIVIFQGEQGDIVHITVCDENNLQGWKDEEYKR